MGARSAWPVHVSLVCAAALLAMAYRYHGGGVWMAGMAAMPLFITRFSFERYARARRTYHQTIQALGIVPEIAGLAAAGHGERTAVYAAAVADELGLGATDRERVVTAARLHHIGYICVDDPDDPAGASLPAAEIARVGASILRETIFLRDVARVVEDTELWPADGGTLEGAIVRVVSAFDETVGVDASRAAAAAAAVARQHRDRQGTRAGAALRRLVSHRPEVVEEAIRAGAPVTRAAAGVFEPALQA